MKINVGSRTSRLARWQTDQVTEALCDAHPDLDVEFVGMESLGDELTDRSVPEIGGEGVFTQRLEAALLDDRIDIAVHSLKDMPTERPGDLMYAGSLSRGAPNDALVATGPDAIEDLPEGATVATGSRRRRAQLRRRRPDIEFSHVRGNIGTRLEKLRDREWDGMIMASVALERLGWEDVIATGMDPEDFVPAVGQGAIGIEVRESRDDVRELLEPVVDTETTTGCRAERTFLRRMQGGCTVPIGGFCRRVDDEWELFGWVGSLDGRTVIEDRRRTDDPQAAADAMAEAFLERGAGEILERVRELDE